MITSHCRFEGLTSGKKKFKPRIKSLWPLKSFFACVMTDSAVRLQIQSAMITCDRPMSHKAQSSEQSLQWVALPACSDICQCCHTLCAYCNLPSLFFYAFQGCKADKSASTGVDDTPERVSRLSFESVHDSQERVVGVLAT